MTVDSPAERVASRYDRADVEAGTATESLPDVVTVSPNGAVEPAVDRWRATLAAARLPDSLIGEDVGVEPLDLTHAHPSGIATLLAGRSTRLSSLVREAAAHAVARRRARAIAAHADQLAAERGVRSCHLAAGLVSWTDGPTRAPLLLRACSLHARGAGHEDYELDLDDSATANPEVVRRLAAHGVRLDPSGLGGLTFGTAGFDPGPAYQLVEECCRDIPGFTLERSLVVGSYTAGSDALSADLDAARLALEIHPLLSRLANATPSMAPAVAPSGPVEGAKPMVTVDPAPEADDAAFDLDPAQRAALDAALGGAHVVVEGPPGTGLTHTLSAVVATLVGRGRHALVVTPHRGTAEAVVRRLTESGFGDLVLDLHDGVGDRPRLLAMLGSALAVASAERPGPGVGPAAGSGQAASGDTGALAARRAAAAQAESQAAARVRRHAEALAAAGAGLHTPREPWGVSAYETMAALAELMARPEPPHTRVRLPLEVCRELDSRRLGELRDDLRAVTELGAFQQTRVDTRWLDAKVADEAAAHEALAAARTAREVLPRAEQAMAGLAEAVGWAPAQTVAQWRPRLELLYAVRSTLDVLQPAVYEQPLEELVAELRADASLGWRARHALHRRVRALVRPGTHVATVAGLLELMEQAAAQRVSWAELVDDASAPLAAAGTAPPAPRVPLGLDAAHTEVAELEVALDHLGRVLEGTGTPDLREQTPERLHHRLIDLSNDSQGLLAQPQRRVLLERLRAAGLAPLLADLAERRPEPHEVGAELDLAWWASVLEAVIRGEPALAGHETGAPQAHADALRETTARLLAARAVRAVASCEVRAARAVAAYPGQAAWLHAEVHRAHRSAWPSDLFRHAGDVVAALRPIWVMSPDAVARCLAPAGASAPSLDVVAVDDASQVGLPEAAAALARARQVVVAGDRRRLPPATGGPSVLEALAAVAVPVSGTSSGRGESGEADRRSPVLCRLDRDHRTRDGRLFEPLRRLYGDPWLLVPGAAAVSPLRLEHVREGTSVPAPGEDVMLSAEAEVARVVDLVAEHAVRRPGESLLVVTLGARHAARIEDALRLELADRPELARWLDVHWASDIVEPFMVRPIHRIPGVERDAVILSVGLARTPHGRVLHRFGVLDGRFGEACLATALSRARRRTTVVCCFSAEDLVSERLRSDGSRMLRELLAIAADPERRGDHPTDTTKPVRAPDALIADLRDRLLAQGVAVVEGPRDLHPWPLALAVADPELPGRRLLAVDVDGPGYAACPSVSTRDRARREALERAGWSYLRLAAMDLFCDPAAEVDRVRDACRRLAGDIAAGGGERTAETAPVGPRQRPPFPEVEVGREITAYGTGELEAVARWALTDGVTRTPEELAALVREALHLPRRGPHVEATVVAAARRALDETDGGGS